MITLKLTKYYLYDNNPSNHIVNLPDDTKICKVGFQNYGCGSDLTKDGRTENYLCVVNHNGDYDNILNNMFPDEKDRMIFHSLPTPTQLIIFFEACVNTESNVKYCTIDDLNEFVDFNYWVKVKSLSYLTASQLKDLYGDDLNKWYDHTLYFIKPLRFTGCGYVINIMFVGNYNTFDTKRLDIIEKRNMDLMELNPLHSYKTTDEWVRPEVVQEYIDGRIKEIITY